MKIINKYFPIFFCLVISLNCIGQSDVQILNGYKYIYMSPLLYKDGSVDYYGIQTRTRDYFMEKGFVIIDDISDLGKMPNEAKENPCLMLRCGIEHPPTSGYRSSLTISFFNCKNQLVYMTKGASIMGADEFGNYRLALKKALKNIMAMNYSYTGSLTQEIEYPKVETVDETETTLRNYFDTNKLDAIEGIYKSYQSKTMGYCKFAIKKRDDKYIAIIIESEIKAWKRGEIVGYFENSSIADLYSVKWYMGNKILFETFGDLENEELLAVEFKQQNGDKKQDKFIKMYPAKENSKTTIKKSAGASGSGFFISTRGLIATNAHVVEDGKDIEVNVSGEEGNLSFKAKLILIDNKNDVAIIQIDDEKFENLSSLPYGIAEKAEIGEKAFTIGYPLNDIMGTNYKVTDGIISARSGIADDIRYYQISVPLQPGNSGGPLFNKDGNIIGITSAKLNSKAIGTAIENVNYAIKAAYLTDLINMLPDSHVLTPSNQFIGKELKDQIKILKNYVCLIKVSY